MITGTLCIYHERGYYHDNHAIIQLTTLRDSKCRGRFDMISLFNNENTNNAIARWKCNNPKSMPLMVTLWQCGQESVIQT